MRSTPRLGDSTSRCASPPEAAFAFRRATRRMGDATPLLAKDATLVVASVDEVAFDTLACRVCAGTKCQILSTR